MIPSASSGWTAAGRCRPHRISCRRSPTCPRRWAAAHPARRNYSRICTARCSDSSCEPHSAPCPAGRSSSPAEISPDRPRNMSARTGFAARRSETPSLRAACSLRFQSEPAPQGQSPADGASALPPRAERQKTQTTSAHLFLKSSWSYLPVRLLTQTKVFYHRISKKYSAHSAFRPASNRRRFLPLIF